MIKKAVEIAMKGHAAQKYDRHTFTKHLEDVHKEVVRFHGSDNKILIASAWLHDVVEDTEYTIEDIYNLFGNEVGDIVYRVTDEIAITRKESKEKTYKKIKGHKNATIIKLADRIANSLCSIVERDIGNNIYYNLFKEEYPQFRELIYQKGLCEDMWEKLDKIWNYKKKEKE